MKIVTTEQMSSIENVCAKNKISNNLLMENAGLKAAKICKNVLSKNSTANNRNTLIMVGSGNNGGDGLVVARHLSKWGETVTVYNCSQPGRIHKKASELPEGIKIVQSKSDNDMKLLSGLVSEATIVVDGIIGTGMTRPISGQLQLQLELLKLVQKNRPKLIVISLDLPTGINTDTGQTSICAVSADITVAFGYPKIAHYTMPAATNCGSVSIVDIGIPEELGQGINVALITPEWVKSKLPKRSMNAHKGDFGKVLFVGGCQQYKGAAYLATRASTRVGTGLVTAATPASIQLSLVSKIPEITYLSLPETADGHIDSTADKKVLSSMTNYDAMLIGCGIGLTDSTASFLVKLLLSGFQLPSSVIDADALTILSKQDNWYKRFNQLAILTPHFGEMSRLIESNASIPGYIPMETIIGYAQMWNKIVVLKGPYTRVVSPNGGVLLSPFANPGLASAGTGDVLAGIITGLLAQGLNMTDSAALGVYIHATAGERIKNKTGDAGMVASDLLDDLPSSIAYLKGV